MPRLKLNLLAPKAPWTKTPNILLDRLIPILKDTELRVLLVLIRQTYGWNRANRTVTLSYQLLANRTGRHSEAISRALKGLAAKGLIHTVTSKRHAKTSESEATYTAKRTATNTERK